MAFEPVPLQSLERGYLTVLRIRSAIGDIDDATEFAEAAAEALADYATRLAEEE